MGKAIMHALSAALTVVDYVSDIMLGFEYLTSNNPVWGGLTLAFIAGPAISAIYIGAYVCPEEDKNKFGEKLFYIWKGSEVCLESGPQVILQLYILALSDLDRSTVSGIVIFKTSTGVVLNTDLALTSEKFAHILERKYDLTDIKWRH